MRGHRYRCIIPKGGLLGKAGVGDEGSRAERSAARLAGPYGGCYHPAGERPREHTQEAKEGKQAHQSLKQIREGGGGKGRQEPKRFPRQIRLRRRAATGEAQGRAGGRAAGTEKGPPGQAAADSHRSSYLASSLPGSRCR